MGLLAAISAVQSALTAPAARPRMKVLLVDDSRDNLFSIQTALEPLGEELMLANSGKEALRLCLDNDFAAILLDVRMPDMDGFETAEMIRSRKRSKHTPLLFLTAYRSDEQLFRGYDLGAVDFLFRPVVPEILQSKVRAFVDLSRTADLLRRQAETLAKAELKFRSVLEAAPDAMVITRGDGTILLANSRTDSLFGYTRDHLIGENIRLLVPHWVCDCKFGPLDEENAGAPPPASVPLRLTGITKRRVEVPVEITSSPLPEDDEFLVTSAIRDVTEQVRVEESIRRMNAELERRVAERTAELTRSNEALRQFAWAASHDLQEPLRMVVSFSQLLGESAKCSLDETALQALEFVENNALRMELLLGGLRQYLRVSESDQDSPHVVDAGKVLATAIENLSGMIGEAQAEVTWDPLPTLRCPDVLLLQLFQNLISNAVKYRDDACSPCIHVSVETTGAEYVFGVADNGIGIEPEYAEHIFGVFKRLNRNKSSGTGIGLAICRAAVARLGGRIWVESEVGKGSTFRFSVPRERAQCDEGQ